MKNSRRITARIAAAGALALCLCAAAVSFATADSSTEAADQQVAGVEQAAAPASKDDPYVSNAVCLGCHGGTQQALEELTADLGDSNPHGGTHGSGGIACNVCHQSGAQIPTDEENICLDCHAWPRPEQSLLQYMDL